MRLEPWPMWDPEPLIVSVWDVDAYIVIIGAM